MVWSEYATQPPPTGTLIGRGLRTRCPLCGSGRVFDGVLHMRERCPRCDLRFERVEGHWIGAIGINTVLSFGLLLLVVVVGVAVTYPRPTFAPLAALAGTTALLAPLAFHRLSRTLWTAIDLAMRPVEASEITSTGP